MAQMIFTVAANADDVTVFTDTATYVSTGTPVYDTGATDTIRPARDISGGRFYVGPGLFRWNTAALPDFATVTGATFRFYSEHVDNVDSLSITGDWTSWSGTNAAADWSYGAPTGAFSAIALSNFTAVQEYDIALSNADVNVSLTGITYLRIFVTQRASDAAPTGENDIHIGSIEHATATPPRLIVTYTVPTSRIAPDAILAQTNLTGAVAAIQDDPDSADATWLTAP